TYTAQAIQSDDLGNIGLSTPQTFTVGASTGVQTTTRLAPKPRVLMVGSARVRIKGRKLHAKIRVPLKLSCKTANCTGQVTLTVVETMVRKGKQAKQGNRAKHGRKRTHRRKTLTCARASYKLRAGKTIRVTVTLTKAGRTAIVHARRHILRLTETVTVRGGATVKRRVVVRLVVHRTRARGKRTRTK
ncbi:MAG: hypothetical protein ACRDNS_34850, partial [Trebonia sp.]